MNLICGSEMTGVELIEYKYEEEREKDLLEGDDEVSEVS